MVQFIYTNIILDLPIIIFKLKVNSYDSNTSIIEWQNM